MLIHLSKCHDVTREAKEQDLGTRSGCHSNVPELKAVLFFNFFVFIRFGRFACLVSVVSVVSFVTFTDVVMFTVRTYASHTSRSKN